MPIALAELEVALDAVWGNGLELLAAVRERKLQMPQVFRDVTLLHRGPLRDFTRGELGLT